MSQLASYSKGGRNLTPEQKASVFWLLYSKGIIAGILSTRGVNINEAELNITYQGVNTVAKSYFKECPTKDCVKGFMNAVEKLRDQGYITDEQYNNFLLDIHNTLQQINKDLSIWYFQNYVVKAFQMVGARAAAIPELMKKALEKKEKEKLEDYKKQLEKYLDFAEMVEKVAKGLSIDEETKALFLLAWESNESKEKESRYH